MSGSGSFGKKQNLRVFSIVNTRYTRHRTIDIRGDEVSLHGKLVYLGILLVEKSPKDFVLIRKITKLVTDVYVFEDYKNICSRIHRMIQNLLDSKFKDGL